MGRGRPPKISDCEILRAVALAPDPIVTAPELSGRLDYTRQGVRGRLKDLEEEGLMKSREVGSRAVVYWMTPDSRQKLADC
jgi:predicted ArsR family transcriptional regulator